MRVQVNPRDALSHSHHRTDEPPHSHHDGRGRPRRRRRADRVSDLDRSPVSLASAARVRPWRRSLRFGRAGCSGAACAGTLPRPHPSAMTGLDWAIVAVVLGLTIVLAAIFAPPRLAVHRRVFLPRAARCRGGWPAPRWWRRRSRPTRRSRSRSSSPSRAWPATGLWWVRGARRDADGVLLRAAVAAERRPDRRPSSSSCGTRGRRPPPCAASRPSTSGCSRTPSSIGWVVLAMSTVFRVLFPGPDGVRAERVLPPRSGDGRRNAGCGGPDAAHRRLLARLRALGDRGDGHVPVRPRHDRVGGAGVVRARHPGHRRHRRTPGAAPCRGVSGSRPSWGTPSRARRRWRSAGVAFAALPRRPVGGRAGTRGAEPGGGGYIAPAGCSRRGARPTPCWRCCGSRSPTTASGRGPGFSWGWRRSCSTPGSRPPGEGYVMVMRGRAPGRPARAPVRLVPRRVHVHDLDPAQLGHELPRERPLPAVHGDRPHGAPLRPGSRACSRSFLAVGGFLLATQLDSVSGAWGLLLSASAGMGPRPHPAVVLVARQRLERADGDGRALPARPRPSSSSSASTSRS